MVVRIRLSRLGGRHVPIYRIVVANARSKRDGLPLEALGMYSPVPNDQGYKLVDLLEERVNYWLSVGAQPSTPVKKLLAMARIIPELPFELRPFQFPHTSRRFRTNQSPPPLTSHVGQVFKKEAELNQQQLEFLELLNTTEEEVIQPLSCT